MSFFGVTDSDHSDNFITLRRDTEIVIPGIHLLDRDGIPPLDSSSCWHLIEVDDKSSAILRDVNFAFSPRVIVPRDKLGANRGIASPILVDLELVELNELIRGPCFRLILWTTIKI